MLKKIFIIAAATALVLNLTAQDKNDTALVRNIEIERDYTPEIILFERPNVEFGIQEPQKNNTKINYSNYSVPLQMNNNSTKANFVPIAPQEFNITANGEKNERGFFRLGAGALLSWFAEIGYVVWNTDDSYLDTYFHHDGILGLGKKPVKKLFNTGGGANFTKTIGETELYFSVKYFNESFNYYGQDGSAFYDTILDINQSFHKAYFTLGYKTNQRNSNGWNHNVYVNYRLHSTKSGITEHNIKAGTQLDLELWDNNLLVNGGISTFFYRNRETNQYLLFNDKFNPYSVSNIDFNHWKTNVIVDICPAYLINLNDLKISLGVKAFFNFGKNTPIALTPDAQVDYFVKKFLNLYAGITGDFHINSLANITAENRYYQLDNASQYHTYTPFDIFMGFKIKVLKGLLFDASINYKYVSNKIFYKNNLLEVRDSVTLVSNYVYNKVFAPVYAGGTLFNASFRVSYNIKDAVDIYAQLKYNGWKLNKKQSDTVERLAWHTPVWQLETGTKFTFGKIFFGNINFYFAQGAKAEKMQQQQQIVDLPAIYDLNLGTGCNVSKNFSLFFKANNILAVSKRLNYQSWYGYDSMGANFIIGATVQF
jgi:hypothetical protein